MIDKKFETKPIKLKPKNKELIVLLDVIQKVLEGNLHLESFKTRKFNCPMWFDLSRHCPLITLMFTYWEIRIIQRKTFEYFKYNAESEEKLQFHLSDLDF